MRNLKKTLSLLHLVGLLPQVYYTLTIFFWGGGEQGPLAHLLNTPMDIISWISILIHITHTEKIVIV